MFLAAQRDFLNTRYDNTLFLPLSLYWFLGLYFTGLCVSSFFCSFSIFIGGLLRALRSGQKNIREFTYLCQVCFQANINSFNPSNNDMRTVALLPPHLTDEQTETPEMESLA